MDEPPLSDSLADCFFYDKQGNLKEKIKYMPINGIFSPSGIYVYDGVKVIPNPDARDFIEYELSDIATGKMKAMIDRNLQKSKKSPKIDLCLTDLFVDDKHFRKTEIEDGDIWKPVYYERKKDGTKVKISPESELYNKLSKLENQYLSETYSKIKKAEILLRIIERQEASRRLINTHYSS